MLWKFADDELARLQDLCLLLAESYHQHIVSLPSGPSPQFSKERESKIVSLTAIYFPALADQAKEYMASCEALRLKAQGCSSEGLQPERDRLLALKEKLMSSLGDAAASYRFHQFERSRNRQ
jgi:hypothetical protein